MPYRIDLHDAPGDAVDRLIDLGALDVEAQGSSVAALMPDNVDANLVSASLRRTHITVSVATPRDDGSVWILRPRVVRAGGLTIAPADRPAPPDAIRLADGAAFGTGLHPTTVLCLELLADAIDTLRPTSLLDIGTGSGILALAALAIGVPHAVGIDISPHAIRIAAENARLNAASDRLQLIHGGPDAIRGSWTLIVANVLAAPLVEMAPAVVRVVGHRGRLILSGIPSSVESDVAGAYRRLGMNTLRSQARAGWTAIVLEPTW